MANQKARLKQLFEEPFSSAISLSFSMKGAECATLNALLLPLVKTWTGFSNTTAIHSPPECWGAHVTPIHFVILCFKYLEGKTLMPFLATA